MFNIHHKICLQKKIPRKKTSYIFFQGLWAALLILELFDPEFRALFKAKLAKVI